MHLSIRSITLAAANLALLACAVAQDPYFSLEAMLERQGRISATALQRRADPFANGTVLVKVVTRSDKGEMSRIIQPLELQGIRQLDDRSTMRTYYPDSNTISNQMSSARWRLGIPERMRLIRANYKVTFGERANIAEKRAQALILDPKSDYLDKRIIWYDVNNRFILRYQVMGRDGLENRVDTLSVTYDQPSSSEFNLPEAERVRNRYGPFAMASAGDAESYLNAYPPVPSSWPYGFKQEALQIVGSENEPILAVRLTDGMAPITVYFWNPDQHRRPPIRSGPIVELSGLKIGGAGDGQSRLIERLVNHAGRRSSWDQEQIGLDRLFENDIGVLRFDNQSHPRTQYREATP
ncbi:MAG: hypothetical protein KF812_01760 [Fimbriimonadaceae bacterium]|nr:hypothetical protein [Fimbriimonadaceae bacterium]